MANQCLVIDYATDTQTERYFGYAKLFCEETGRYDIKTQLKNPVKDDVASRELFGPGAVPEQSFRGYYRESGIHFDQTDYQVFPTKLESQSTPVYEGSTALFEITGANEKSLIANVPKTGSKTDLTTKKAPDVRSSKKQDPIVVASLSSSSTNHLKGKLTHHLNEPITDWILVYGKIVYFVKKDNPMFDLDPAERIELPNRRIRQREFSSFMTGTTSELIRRGKSIDEELLVQRQNYNPFSTDLTTILRTMTFFDAIGGQQYTSLTNRELSSWDFSRLLELHRAVLIGRLKKPALQTTVDGKPVRVINNDCFLRLVIPVRQGAAELERLPDYGN